MKRIKGLVILMATMIAVLMFGSVAFAGTYQEPGKVEELKQTKASDYSVSFEWKTCASTGYEISYSIDGGNNWVVKDSATTDYNGYINGLSAGVRVLVRVRAFNNDYVTMYKDTRVYGPYSDPVEMVTETADMGTISEIDATTSSVTLSWASVTNAMQYRIASYNYTSGTETTIATVKDTTTVIANLEAANRYNYYFRIYPQIISNAGFVAEGSYKTFSGVTLVTGKITDLTYTNSLGWLEWTTPAGSEGYELEVYNGKKLYKKYTGTSNYETLSNIKSNVFYKARIRTYVTVAGNKKYSEWSNTTYFANQVDLKLKRVSSKKIRLSWKKVKGAKNYTIYASTNSRTGFKKIATTKKTKYVATKIKKKAINLKKKPAFFYVVANTKAEGKKWKSRAYRTIGYNY
ncbi:MAG: fibronectin type III domain-containing protein [Lachnospiraceae bacterium]|nr:fibronectin type III domain-containing protein [Lachnospiraceae bacterium]